MIRKRNKTSKEITPTLVFNTFIYGMLATDTNKKEYDYNKYKRIWERRLNIDITKIEQILFPINKDNIHWILCRVITNKNNPLVEIYDSLPNSNEAYMKNVAKVVSILLNDAFANYGIKETWKWNKGVCPIQENGYDCGVCLCTNIEFLSRGQQPQYAGKDTAYFRKKIAIELYKEEIISFNN